MNSNIIPNILKNWFYNDIINIILSYKMLDHEEIIFEKKVVMKCNNIIVVNNRLYLQGNEYYGRCKSIYLDLSSKEILTDTYNGKYGIFKGYFTYNIILRGLLFGTTFKLYHKKHIFFTVNTSRLKICGKYIFYNDLNSICYRNLEDNFSKKTFCSTKKDIDIDFDVYGGYLYVYINHYKLLVYDISNIELKYEIPNLHKIRDPTKKKDDIIQKNYFCRIFVTNDFIFLYEITYVLIFFKDLTFFRWIDLPTNSISSYNNGFYVKDNIIYIYNKNLISAYRLF